MATGPGKDDSGLLARLAEGLPDQELDRLFPGQAPDTIRARLLALAGRTPAPAQMKLPAGGKERCGCFVLHTDGASRGNPGQAGAGACIFDPEGREVFADGLYLGTCTNNVAEYQALLLGLERAADLRIKDLEVRLDSELIVRQLQGRYRVKDEKLRPLFDQVRQLVSRFASCRFQHVPRSQNARADELANQAIDRNPKQ